MIIQNPKPELIYSNFFNFKIIVRIILKNNTELVGIIQSFSPGTGKIGEIKIWYFIEVKNKNKYNKTKSQDLIRDVYHSDIKSIEPL